MADDKYAPKSTDGPKEVHARHRQLIADQRAINKKAREETSVKTEAPNPNPTQTQVPQNPDSPQNQPVK